MAENSVKGGLNDVCTYYGSYRRRKPQDGFFQQLSKMLNNLSPFHLSSWSPWSVYSLASLAIPLRGPG